MDASSPAMEVQSQEVPVTDLAIIGQYNLQRFVQFNPEDVANWTMTPDENGKSPMVFYPAMGRKHISFLNQNILVFSSEPRDIFRSINYLYIVVGSTIYRYDQFFNRIVISQGKVTSISGPIYFTYLVAGTITFACFTDGIHIYISREDTASFDVVTDSNAPPNPTYIAAFGNRITVSVGNSSQFNLSADNLDGNSFSASTCFTVNGKAVFAQANGIIRQMGVLHNTLYIFCNFTTDVWSNQNVSYVAGGTLTTFPWKQNSTYNFDFGIADPQSLDIDFDRMTWLAENRSGLLQVMSSTGGTPERVSNKAVDVLFQKYASSGASPFTESSANGFLYQFENVIFYRLSAGSFLNTGLLDQQSSANSLEYCYETKSWKRCVEKNGERNRIKKHAFFSNRHLVTVDGDSTVYEMSGLFYTNEITNPAATSPQEENAYIAEPFLYERVTPILREKDYSESIYDYVEIDFVFGDSNISFSDSPFANAQFIIDEDAGLDGQPVFAVTESPGPDGQPVYIIAQRGNEPEIDSTTYNKFFKPHIELYYSDDGGISYRTADVRQFSDMGVYQWRMRWYELGTSRNRCFKLVCVSPVPIVILGAVVLKRRASGGAN